MTAASHVQHMAIIDVVDHTDKTTGRRDWNRVDQRRKSRSWRRQCRLWLTRARQDPRLADAHPEPTRSQVQNAGHRNGRSLLWWIQGVVRREGVIEIESLRKQLLGCLDPGLWRRVLGAFDTAVGRAVERGLVLRVGSMLVSARLASRIVPVESFRP